MRTVNAIVWPVVRRNRVCTFMATAQHFDRIDHAQPAARRWVELAWMVKTWGIAAFAVLLLEVAGLHPSGVLMRLWSYLPGF